MKKMKVRIISLAMSVMMVFSAGNLTVFAKEITGDEKEVVANSEAVNDTGCPYEEGTAEYAIYMGLLNMQDEIDVSVYNLSDDEYWDMVDRIAIENPALFHVRLWRYDVEYGDNWMISKFLPAYSLEGTSVEEKKTEYAAMLAEIETATEHALSGITDTMSDFEKTLFLHDYVLNHSDYDWEGWRYGDGDEFSSTLYGCLVKGISNSYGYSLTYKYLLEKIGIECEIITGWGLSWNAVLLNGEYYFVDLHFDNPITNHRGSSFDYVGHNFFLVTAAELRDLGTGYHEEWNQEIFPTDTTYSDAAFRKVDSPFSYYNGEWYYWVNYENNQKNPVIAKTEDPTEVGTVIGSLADFKWKLFEDPTKVWKGYQGNVGICAERKELYYSSDSQIFCMDLEDLTKEPELIYTADIRNGYVYGLKVEGDSLIYCISTAPSREETLYTLSLDELRENCKAGDVSGDGVIDANDALSILKKIVAINPGNLIELAADCNEDGVIDANDALWILKIVAKMDMGQIK